MRVLKIFIIISLYIASTSFKPAEDLKWMGWNDGYTLAKKKKKILLVDCYTEWCGWCKKMDRDTYSNPVIQQKIYNDFVPVKFNPELDQTYVLDGKQYNGPQLLALLWNNRSSGYPTIVFMIPNGKTTTLELSIGYSDAAGFSKILDDMKGKQK